MLTVCDVFQCASRSRNSSSKPKTSKWVMKKRTKKKNKSFTMYQGVYRHQPSSGFDAKMKRSDQTEHMTIKVSSFVIVTEACELRWNRNELKLLGFLVCILVDHINEFQLLCVWYYLFESSNSIDLAQTYCCYDDVQNGNRSSSSARCWFYISIGVCIHLNNGCWIWSAIHVVLLYAYVHI